MKTEHTDREAAARPQAGRDWRQVARVYQERARQYDAWYEDSLLFAIELEALLAIGEELPRPRLEIGAGPGRFGARLGVDVALDPAPAALQLARQRGMMAVVGIGEELPIRSRQIGTVFLLFTLCFLADPRQVFRECARVLGPGGRLVTGLVPGLSAWGELLTRKKHQGNPYYRYAEFRTIARWTEMLAECGLEVTDARSTLFQAPEKLQRHEKPRHGTDERAGFCVLVARVKESAP
ncbi:MAG TPA: class I SAM-dependent methyltransferase [Desulfobulbus sp.]|nr:class I SAM-dependent methyltransferase [Desulfobulbus sp.]